MKNTNIVLASEIGEYVYCKRSWWLKFKGLSKSTYAMELGSQKHNELADNLHFFPARKILAIVLIVISLLLIGVIITLSVL